MLDRLTTNETQFFREARQFEFLETVVFPEWKRAGDRGSRPKRVKAWSSACSTGEEAYSLAMSLLRHFPTQERWSIDVLGTDLSTQVLEVAREATYPVDQAKAIPQAHLKRFMRRGVRSQEGRMCVGTELKSVVRFERLNLHAERYHVAGPFDVILCRNVLIYFGEPARTAALQRVASLLAEGGYLLLGHAESPGRALEGLEPVQTMIFRNGPTRPTRTDA
jgi:chemotaxis protein methyltransferase CheR